MEVPAEVAGDLDHKIAGRGSCFADIDGDGDLDVLVVQVGGEPMLLRNDQELGHRWLRVRLVGDRSNVDAIGAWVDVEVDGARLRRMVTPTRSYLSQSELPVTFGLGNAERVDSIEVTWPDGTRQAVPVPAALDAEIVVHRDS
jgi:hypothetical protein